MEIPDISQVQMNDCFESSSFWVWPRIQISIIPILPLHIHSYDLYPSLLPHFIFVSPSSASLIPTSLFLVPLLLYLPLCHYHSHFSLFLALCLSLFPLYFSVLYHANVPSIEWHSWRVWGQQDFKEIHYLFSVFRTGSHVCCNWVLGVMLSW